MWEVYLSPDAQNFLKKQDKNISERIIKGLKKLKEDDPFHYLEHFEGEDYYKFRVGKYRALIDIDFKNKILKVQVLDKRNVIYKKR